MTPEIYYQGHGSLRLTTSEGFVVYIDPYAGDGYGVPADLILVSHQHGDHNRIQLPARKPGCLVRQNFDLLKDGQYLSETFGPLTVRAVQAYNRNHPRSECVGFILEFDGLKVYAACDTSRTEQMDTLAEEHIDYAFLPTDGIYNMDPAEASVCAGIIKARRAIPYHMAPGKLFDRKKAEKFEAQGRIILPAGETLRLEIADA